MENKQLVYDLKKIIPANGVQFIIRGIRYRVTNPLTQEEVWAGDGEVLYDIKNKRNEPMFVLKFLKD